MLLIKAMKIHEVHYPDDIQPLYKDDIQPYEPNKDILQYQEDDLVAGAAKNEELEKFRYFAIESFKIFSKFDNEVDIKLNEHKEYGDYYLSLYSENDSYTLCVFKETQEEEMEEVYQIEDQMEEDNEPIDAQKKYSRLYYISFDINDKSISFNFNMEHISNDFFSLIIKNNEIMNEQFEQIKYSFYVQDNSNDRYFNNYESISLLMKNDNFEMIDNNKLTISKIDNNNCILINVYKQLEEGNEDINIDQNVLAVIGLDIDNEFIKKNSSVSFFAKCNIKGDIDISKRDNCALVSNIYESVNKIHIHDINNFIYIRSVNGNTCRIDVESCKCKTIRFEDVKNVMYIKVSDSTMSCLVFERISNVNDISISSIKLNNNSNEENLPQSQLKSKINGMESPYKSQIGLNKSRINISGLKHKDQDNSDELIKLYESTRSNDGLNMKFERLSNSSVTINSCSNICLLGTSNIRTVFNINKNAIKKIYFDGDNNEENEDYQNQGDEDGYQTKNNNYIISHNSGKGAVVIDDLNVGVGHFISNVDTKLICGSSEIAARFYDKVYYLEGDKILASNELNLINLSITELKVGPNIIWFDTEGVQYEFINNKKIIKNMCLKRDHSKYGYLNCTQLIRQLVYLNNHSNINDIEIDGFEIYDENIFKYLNYKNIKFTNCKFKQKMNLRLSGVTIKSISIDSCITDENNNIDINFINICNYSVDVFIVKSKIDCNFSGYDCVLNTKECGLLVIAGNLNKITIEDSNIVLQNLKCDTIKGVNSDIKFCYSLTSNQVSGVKFSANIKNCNIKNLDATISDNITIDQLQSDSISFSCVDNEFKKLILKDSIITKSKLVGFEFDEISDCDLGELNMEACRFEDTKIVFGSSCELKNCNGIISLKSSLNGKVKVIKNKVQQLVKNIQIEEDFIMAEDAIVENTNCIKLSLDNCSDLFLDGESYVEILEIKRQSAFGLSLNQKSTLLISSDNICRNISSIDIKGKLSIKNSNDINSREFSSLLSIKMDSAHLYKITGQYNFLNNVEIKSKEISFENFTLSCNHVKLTIGKDVKFSMESSMCIISDECFLYCNSNTFENLNIKYSGNKNQSLSLDNGVFSIVENFVGILSLTKIFTLNKSGECNFSEIKDSTVLQKKPKKVVDIKSDQGVKVNISYKLWKSLLDDENRVNFECLPVKEISVCDEINSWQSMSSTSCPVFIGNKVFESAIDQFISKFGEGVFDELFLASNHRNKPNNIICIKDKDSAGHFIRDNSIDEYKKLFEIKKNLYCFYGKNGGDNGLYLYTIEENKDIAPFVVREVKVGNSEDLDFQINDLRIYDDINVNSSVIDKNVNILSFDENGVIDCFIAPDELDDKFKPPLNVIGEDINNCRNYCKLDDFNETKNKINTLGLNIYCVPHFDDGMLRGVYLYASICNGVPRKLIVSLNNTCDVSSLDLRDYYVVADNFVVPSVDSVLSSLYKLKSLDTSKSVSNANIDSICNASIISPDAREGDDGCYDLSDDDLKKLNETIDVAHLASISLYLFKYNIDKENVQQGRDDQQIKDAQQAKKTYVILYFHDKDINKLSIYTPTANERLAKEANRRRFLSSVVKGLVFVALFILGLFVAFVALWKKRMLPESISDWLSLMESKIKEEVNNRDRRNNESEDDQRQLKSDIAYVPPKVVDESNDELDNNYIDDMRIDISRLRDSGGGIFVDRHGSSYVLVRGFYVNTVNGNKYDNAGNRILEESIKITNAKEGGYFVDDDGRFYKFDPEDCLYLNIINGYRYTPEGEFVDVLADDSDIVIIGKRGGLFVDEIGRSYRFNEVSQTYVNTENGYKYGFSGAFIDIDVDIDDSSVVIYVNEDPIFIDENKNLYLFDSRRKIYRNIENNKEYNVYGDFIGNGK